MMKKRLLPLLLAGMLLVFSGCDASDGKVDDKPSSGTAVGDAASDIGEGVGDMVSDLGDDVSDGLDGMTGGEPDKDASGAHDGDAEDKTGSSHAGDGETDGKDRLEDETLDEKPDAGGSVTAMEGVTTEKKTGLT